MSEQDQKAYYAEMVAEMEKGGFEFDSATGTSMSKARLLAGLPPRGEAVSIGNNRRHGGTRALMMMLAATAGMSIDHMVMRPMMPLPFPPPRDDDEDNVARKNAYVMGGVRALAAHDMELVEARHREEFLRQRQIEHSRDMADRKAQEGWYQAAYSPVCPPPAAERSVKAHPAKKAQRKAQRAARKKNR